MSDAKRHHDWDIGSMIIAKINNVHVTKDEYLINPASIHPFMDDEPVTNIIPVPRKIQTQALKAMAGIK